MRQTCTIGPLPTYVIIFNTRIISFFGFAGLSAADFASLTSKIAPIIRLDAVPYRPYRCFQSMNIS